MGNHCPPPLPPRRLTGSVLVKCDADGADGPCCADGAVWMRDGMRVVGGGCGPVWVRGLWRRMTAGGVGRARARRGARPDTAKSPRRRPCPCCPRTRPATGCRSPAPPAPSRLLAPLAVQPHQVSRGQRDLVSRVSRGRACFCGPGPSWARTRPWRTLALRRLPGPAFPALPPAFPAFRVERSRPSLRPLAALPALPAASSLRPPPRGPRGPCPEPRACRSTRAPST